MKKTRQKTAALALVLALMLTPIARAAMLVEVRASIAETGGGSMLSEMAQGPVEAIRWGWKLVDDKAEMLLEPITKTEGPGESKTYWPMQYYLRGSEEHGMDIQTMWAMGLTGQGVTVAVLDSGLSTTPLDGPAHKVTDVTVVADGGGEETAHYAFEGNEDTDGHGTLMAGVIAAPRDNGLGMAGIAPECSILPIRVFGSEAVTPMEEAIDLAVACGADVINMSCGGEDCPPGLQAAIDRAVAAGCIVVAAAGHGTGDVLSYPAACEGVISVGATDREGYLADFSSRSTQVQVCAPGEEICSLLYDQEYGLTAGDGTSYSAAMVSAVAALLKELDPELTQEEFLALLEKSCEPVLLHDQADAEHTGYGRLNCARLAVMAQVHKMVRPVLTICERQLPAA